MNIGLSLSGGGFRATVFHLGVLARLAEEGRLEEVAFLSTVSGGSLCAGLVVARSGFAWPSSEGYLTQIVPQAFELLTQQGLQFGLIGRVARVPFRLFATRADDLSLLLQRRWGVTGSLRSLPEHPRWAINATCYETGKNWRFERSRMGDYVFGYSEDTDIPLSDALAASAGFPGLVGPLLFDTSGHTWFRFRGTQDSDADDEPAGEGHLRDTVPAAPAYRRLHLWDGGVYDNLGLEALHNFDTGWRSDIDFLIVSDGCSQERPQPYRPWRAAMHMIRGIMMDQIRSLRFRALLERFANHGDAGAYLQIGSTCAQVLRDAGRQEAIAVMCADCLPEAAVLRAAEMGTHLRRLSPEEFTRLLRHAFEVADCTLHAYHADRFGHIGYDRSKTSAALERVSGGSPSLPL